MEEANRQRAVGGCHPKKPYVLSDAFNYVNQIVRIY